MAEEALITVKTIKKTTMERKDGTGTFEAVEVIDTDNTSFNGYATSLPETLKEGDKVKLSYQPILKKDGTSINKILNIHGNSKTKSVMKSGTFKKQTSSFDGKGARVGGAYHDAVALAIHNSGGKTVSVQDVESIANQLLTVMNNTEQGK